MAQPNGSEVRRLRLRNGWTQTELARRIGRTQVAISKVESGKPVSRVLMRQVARALKVKLTAIATLIADEAVPLADEPEVPAEPGEQAALKKCGPLMQPAGRGAGTGAGPDT